MKPLYYLSTINQYLGTYGLYSPQEVVEFDRLEKIWSDSQVSYSFHQLLDIFPDARPRVKQILKEQIKQYQVDLTFAEEWKEKFYNKIIYRVSFTNRWFYIWLRDWLLEDLTEGKDAIIKKNRYLLSSLDPKKTTGNPGKITEMDIARAKEVPLSMFLKINNAGFARCPLHEDKTPSLKVYRNKNTFYCFSCNTGRDVVDLVQKINNCTFLEAVKILINK